MTLTRLDPVQLFLDADIVVQAVIFGLILASIWVWTIIVSFSMRMGKLSRRTTAFENEFWASTDPLNADYQVDVLTKNA